MVSTQNEKNIFVENLKRHRKSKGLTQQELADKLYLTRTSYSSYEQGISDPNIYTLLRICTILGTDIAKLFETD